MSIRLFSVFLCLTFSMPVFSQRQTTTNLNAWYMYFGDHKISDQFGIHLEAQWRRNGLVNTPMQLLLRPGINYTFSSTVFATIGYGFIETHPYGDFAVPASFPEHRIWEQLQFKNQQGIFEWISRFRLEQRFSKLPVMSDDTFKPGNAVYTNRFRLFNRFSIPFNGRTITDHSLYVSVYDEIMINFGNNVGNNIFDQNRAYIAVGYKYPKLGKIELGYLHQQIFKTDGIKVENNNTIQLSLISNIPFYNQ
jgi:hypothetical protein